MLQIWSFLSLEVSRESRRSSSVLKKLQKPVTIVTASTLNRQIELRPSSNRMRSADTGTGRSNRGPIVIAVAVQQSGTKRLNRDLVAIAVAQQLFGTRRSSQIQVVMAVALRIRKLIEQLNSKSRESLHCRAIYRNRSAYRSAERYHCVRSVRCFPRTLMTFPRSLMT